MTTLEMIGGIAIVVALSMIIAGSGMYSLARIARSQGCNCADGMTRQDCPVHGHALTQETKDALRRWV